MSAKWTSEQIPEQSGRTAVVTGANSGLGLISARELARHGATVVLACRNMGKGEEALHGIEASVAGARVELAELDLGSLASIESFAERFRTVHKGLDLLLNNAGVMAPPRRQTADGFELQLGTNLLGHFALTGRLIGVLEGRPDARVVTLSSNAHKMGRIDFDDLQSERRYRRWSAYGQSKLADLMFALELRPPPAGRRLDGHERGGPSGVRGHQSPDGRPAHGRSPGDDLHEPDPRPERGDGRAAVFVCRHLSRPPRRELRWPGRDRRISRPPTCRLSKSLRA